MNLRNSTNYCAVCRDDPLPAKKTKDARYGHSQKAAYSSRTKSNDVFPNVDDYPLVTNNWREA